MGTSRSPEALARKFGQLAAELDDLPKTVVGEASLDVKKAVLRRAPARLSGVGKNGAKLGVRYNVGTFDGQAKSLVYATGPFHLIERDTKKHRIPRERRSKKRRLLSIPGIGVRAWANHPGTRGKHPWAKGVDDAMPGVKELLDNETLQILRRIF